jgi:hypothetical protein
MTITSAFRMGRSHIGFDGFEHVNESDLPKNIDTFHLGDTTKQPFTNRFRFRSRGYQ